MYWKPHIAVPMVLLASSLHEFQGSYSNREHSRPIGTTFIPWFKDALTSKKHNTIDLFTFILLLSFFSSLEYHNEIHVVRDQPKLIGLSPYHYHLLLWHVWAMRQGVSLMWCLLTWMEYRSGWWNYSNQAKIVWTDSLGLGRVNELIWSILNQFCTFLCPL
jgi:hypothetical protein